MRLAFSPVRVTGRFERRLSIHFNTHLGFSSYPILVVNIAFCAKLWMPMLLLLLLLLLL